MIINREGLIFPQAPGDRYRPITQIVTVKLEQAQCAFYTLSSFFIPAESALNSAVLQHGRDIVYVVRLSVLINYVNCDDNLADKIGLLGPFS